MGEINWIVGRKGYACQVLPHACPYCGHQSITELPPPILAQQTDGTTHVCHPGLDGCNQGFAYTPTPTNRKTRKETKP